MTEEFSFLLRLGKAKSHWLKMTCINQFLRQIETFTANVECAESRSWRWDCVKIMSELTPKKKVGQRRNALFPTSKGFLLTLQLLL